MDAAGDLFGTVFAGGPSNAGGVFEITKTGGSYSSTPTLITPSNNYPTGNLIADASGDLFGVTTGPSNLGTVFEIIKTGSSYSSTPTTLVSFNSADGARPTGVIMDAAGDLFGTTSTGGAFGDGAVFEITKTGSTYSSTPTVLASFNGTDGATRSESGDGCRRQSVRSDVGRRRQQCRNVVRNHQIRWHLQQHADGSGLVRLCTAESLQGSLIMDAAGDLFGTTAFGGSSSDGRSVRDCQEWR